MAEPQGRPWWRRSGASVGAHALVGMVVVAVGVTVLAMAVTGEERVDGPVDLSEHADPPEHAEPPDDHADEERERETVTSEPDRIEPDPDAPDPDAPDPDAPDPDAPDPDAPDPDDATSEVTVEGEPLPPAERDEHGAVVADPAVGEPAPRIAGTSMDGEPLTLGDPEDDRPQVIVGIAHWCSASRAEVDVLARAHRDGELPEGVDLLAVSTVVDPERDPHTFPPADWLAQAGWGIPTLRDDAASTAVTVLSGEDIVTPYWVAVDADGRILERRTTRQAVDELADWMEELAGSR